MSTPERPTPEEQGIPDHADDDSTAYGEAERPRFRDSPASLPADEPQAVDEYGVTGQEARLGEPLAQRLAREQQAAEPDPEAIGAEELPASASEDELPAEEAAIHEVPEDELPDQQ